MQNPLVTIVTPCYNSADTLQRTIESVLNQTYPHIEYIIMDGASTDDTASIVQPYLDDPRLTFISEPDRGQTHAINKGWEQAQGDVVAWLCADDTYFPHTVQTAVDYLTNHPDVGWVYGHDRYMNADGEPIPFNHNTAAWDYDKYRRQEIYISQPTVFWRKSLFDEFGELREELYWNMDMEFYLRIGKKYPGHLLDETMATITWSRRTKTFDGSIERMVEMEKVASEYGYDDFAKPVRFQWTDAYLAQTFRELGRGNWDASMAALSKAVRYPGYLPRGFARLMVRTLLTERMETRLRQVLIGGSSRS